jgi:hypothetical protein
MGRRYAREGVGLEICDRTLGNDVLRVEGIGPLFSMPSQGRMFREPKYNGWLGRISSHEDLSFREEPSESGKHH